MLCSITCYLLVYYYVLWYNDTMTNAKLEEMIYEFGNVMYRIGRLETDGRDSQKEYNKLVKQKEELTKSFDEFFGTFVKKFS